MRVARIGTALLSVLACGRLALAEPTEDIRIFFDATQTKPNGSLTEHPGPLAFENPVVQSGERLNIYAEFLDEQQWWRTTSFVVEVESGIVTQAHYYNDTRQITYSWGTDERWNAARPNPAIAPNASRVDFLGVEVNRFGLESGSGVRLADTLQYRRPEEDGGSVAGTTLLGFVDVQTSPGEPRADVFFAMGEAGFGAFNSLERSVYFGFGDDPLPAFGSPGRRSEIADATVVPEPSSIALLLGPFLACQRRGRITQGVTTYTGTSVPLSVAAPTVTVIKV